MKKKKAVSKKTNAKSKDNLRFAHNPHYSMIYPSAQTRDDKDITTNSES